MSPMATGRDQMLTPQGLLELATRVAVIRAWRKWGDGPRLRIDLVARGSRIDPPTPLICVHYEAGLPFTEDGSFLAFPSTLSLEKRHDVEQGAQALLDSWREYSPDLCIGLSSFACHIRHTGRTAEIPVGRLYLIFHYIRLRTLLGVKSEAKDTFDDNLTMLLDRFDSFFQQRIKDLKRLGNMLSVD